MTVGIVRDNISIVLQRPRYPENIGSAARAMCNMGFTRLIVVDPGIWDDARIRRLATHTAGDVVDRIQRFSSLEAALAPFGHVVGTTARLGEQRPVIKSPEFLARGLIPIAHNNPVAILFGPEDRGLTNEDLKHCHQLVNIPTVDFSSLNLAQAVMIICYCLATADQAEPKPLTPRLAKRVELDQMYGELTAALMEIGYVNPQNPDYWMVRIRRFFTRLSLRAGEVSIVRGICRQIQRYGARRYTEGQRHGKPIDKG
ncbi:rRNA methyltransferase [Desulfosarcina ovata subsp. sediminis]|uniref:tRNA (cytidine/uridine-2'-O-)-methyltransferase TrmJ n=1 Tax=Desulfosarcina ovata subsp. sediminis TaxID=885957 RepID=A0A5K8A1B8_9BACT|nr:RNA methyltransferase [Desulfosarcina ovata]BBO86375.1 rRNA methyltransferase [Desulfosarcina ovata subsp. sediminis]